MISIRFFVSYSTNFLVRSFVSLSKRRLFFVPVTVLNSFKILYLLFLFISLKILNVLFDISISSSSKRWRVTIPALLPVVPEARTSLSNTVIFLHPNLSRKYAVRIPAIPEPMTPILIFFRILKVLYQYLLLYLLYFLYPQIFLQDLDESQHS